MLKTIWWNLSTNNSWIWLKWFWDLFSQTWEGSPKKYFQQILLDTRAMKIPRIKINMHCCIFYLHLSAKSSAIYETRSKNTRKNSRETRQEEEKHENKKFQGDKGDGLSSGQLKICKVIIFAALWCRLAAIQWPSGLPWAGCGRLRGCWKHAETLVLMPLSSTSPMHLISCSTA